MIKFIKKPEPQPRPAKSDDNRFDQIRTAAAERQKKSKTGDAIRRDLQKAEDDCSI